MRRRLLIALGLVAFLLVSFGLAAALSAGNSERDDIIALLDAQARGDADAMDVDECAGGCPALAARLKRPGEVKLVNIGETEDIRRVVWTTLQPKGRIVVQCIRIDREGGLLSGRSINLQRLSAPIDPEGGCRA